LFDVAVCQNELPVQTEAILHSAVPLAERVFAQRHARFTIFG
jgi:hypothetical protein